jgi:mono/diheme cytochrome c family protein
LFLLPACQQQMAIQPSFKPLDPTEFFPDQRSARPLVPGTVARGHLRTDRALYTGLKEIGARDWAGIVGTAGPTALAAVALAGQQGPQFVDTFPFPVTYDVLKEGHDRYMIYCVVCHDPLGTGQGKIVERGYTPPPSYHIDRLRQAPVGHFFDVMTNGYGSMPDYKQQVTPRERWAVVAYLRALQLSQHFPEQELTPAMRAERESKERAAEAGGPEP